MLINPDSYFNVVWLRSLTALDITICNTYTGNILIYYLPLHKKYSPLLLYYSIYIYLIDVSPIALFFHHEL